jgi:hypothetical protein
MTQTQQLAADLDASLADAQTLIRTQLSNSVQFLLEAHRLDIFEVRHLLEDVLMEFTDVPASVGKVISINSRLVN